MPSLTKIYINEDNKIKIDRVRDSESDAYVNNATATFAVLTSSGATVAGSTGTLAYVTASDGKYVGYLDSSVAANLTDYATYYVAISLSSSGSDLYRRVPVIARYHGAK